MAHPSHYSAVLDHKSAYDTVRRDPLFKRCATVLPDHITALISHTLQTLTVTTVGDDTKPEAKIDRGVTQGGLASPTLFNIFIDTLANELQKHLWKSDCELPAHLYTDDVIIHVRSMLDLQRALIICERWAQKDGMRWALSNGKSEVLLPSELALQYKSIPVRRRPDHNCYSGALSRSSIVRKWNTRMQPQEQNTDVARLTEYTAKCEANIP